MLTKNELALLLNTITFKKHQSELFPENTDLVAEITQLELELSNHNVMERQKITLAQFSNNVIHSQHHHQRKYTSILTSNVKFALIYGPTQLGKTEATLQFVKISLNNNLITIISNDNKTDQQEQMFQRFKMGLANTNSDILKVSDKNFQKKFENCLLLSHRIVIFVLDNSIQLIKLTNILKINSEKLSLKISAVHDEGDSLTRHCNVNQLVEKQADSHKQWILMSQFLESQNIDFKRVFVTATPEAVVKLYDVQIIVELEKPQNYVGYKNIGYWPIQEENLLDILELEINRRLTKQENGIILVCTEKKISHGQDPIFLDYSNNFPAALISTYNGKNGITVRPVTILANGFQNILNNFVTRYNFDKNNKKIKYTQENTIYTIKNMAIRDFYQICKESNHIAIVTIGMDLMSRGISFVSAKKEHDALAATTLIYCPGQKMHAVGLCQTIGRICGTARPDLQRRLYSSESVISNYKAFNKNQKQYLKALRESDGIVSKIIMNQIVLNNKLTRPIDRPALKLKFEYREEEIEGEIDRVKLNKLRKWLNSDTLVGKMIRFLYDAHGEISFEKLMEDIEYEGTEQQFRDNICGGISIGAQYGHLWITSGENIKLNPKIRTFMDNQN